MHSEYGFLSRVGGEGRVGGQGIIYYSHFV